MRDRHTARRDASRDPDRGAALAGCSAGVSVRRGLARERHRPHRGGHLGRRDAAPSGSLGGAALGCARRPGSRVLPLADPPSGVALGIDENTMLVRAPDRWVVFGEGSIFVRAGDEELRLRAGGEMPPEALLLRLAPDGGPLGDAHRRRIRNLRAPNEAPTTSIRTTAPAMGRNHPSRLAGLDGDQHRRAVLREGDLARAVRSRSSKRFLYDLWGDAVNTASWMESQGTPGEIQITQATYELLKDEFVCRPTRR